MPITAAEILKKFSIRTGTAGNSTAGTAAGSLGKYISTTQIPNASIANLFDDITGPENVAGHTDYRCFFVHNSNATLTLTAAVIWLLSEVADGASLALSVDSTAASAIGETAAQAKEVADELTAPAGQTFSAPTSYATGLALGNIGPGQCKAVWVRRTSGAPTAVAGDAAVLRIQGETEP